MMLVIAHLLSHIIFSKTMLKNSGEYVLPCSQAIFVFKPIWYKSALSYCYPFYTNFSQSDHLPWNLTFPNYFPNCIIKCFLKINKEGMDVSVIFQNLLMNCINIEYVISHWPILAKAVLVMFYYVFSSRSEYLQYYVWQNFVC